MKRTLIKLVIVTMLVMSLVGCGSKNASSNMQDSLNGVITNISG